MACLETKKYCVGAFNSFVEETGFPSTLCQAEKLLAVEIPQVAFLGPERRVWRENLAPILVSITASAVAMTGLDFWWQVFLVRYRCGVRVGTSEVEEDSSSEVMGCASSEEMRGAYQYLGECVVYEVGGLLQGVCRRWCRLP